MPPLSPCPRRSGGTAASPWRMKRDAKPVRLARQSSTPRRISTAAPRRATGTPKTKSAGSRRRATLNKVSNGIVARLVRGVWENLTLRYLPALSAALLFAGCGSAPQNASKPESALPLANVDPATAGTITGTVFFDGAAPVMPLVDMSSNPNCEREHRPPKGTPARAETVVVNPNGTLKYVFVWITKGLPEARWTPPSKPAVLDQTGCMYEPHVLGLMTGQPLEILNDDSVNHDVHAEAKVNAAWNESQPPRAEHKVKTFDKAEVMFPVTCNVHPWMRAWLGVSPHPFFAVTGNDGKFTLSGVPPGNYTLEAVHEQYGKKQAAVTVLPHAGATMDFRYGG